MADDILQRPRRIHVWVQEEPGRKYLRLQWHCPHTGQRKSRTTGTTDRREAEQQRSDLEYALNHGLYSGAGNLPWEEFRAMFRREYAAGLRERSQEKFDTVFDVFEEVCRPKQLGRIDERVVSAFVMKLRERKRPGGKIGLAPITIKNYLIALKTALGWAADQKLLTAVPKFPEIKVPKKKPQPIPAEAFERLLGAAPDDTWRAFLLCGWWCGLRLSEARHLRRCPSDKFPWLDLDNDRIVLPAEFAKSDADQWVPLHPTLREALEALPNAGHQFFAFRSRKTGGPLTRNGITSRVILIARKAGVKLSMHKLRKGFGCRVARQLGKGNAPILHRLMRHSSMQVTMDYYANVDDALHDAINTLT
jgi:integrase